MNAISYQWVATDQQLAEVCHVAAQTKAVALDTEFIRTRTFYPKLGLIQLFDGVQVSLIDPLSIHDFSPFVSLLANQKVVKVLHACSEDLEVFQHQFAQLPEPMMDTQIMAAFAGQGNSVGFARLVSHYLSVELDKGASRTDWLARPLSDEQLRYAAADVWFLLPIYEKLCAELAGSPWQHAAQEDCATLLAKRNEVDDPNHAYKIISNAWRLDVEALAILQVLAKWRLEEAKKRDLALNFVIKEASLVQIAELQPKHTSQLLEFMHPNEVRIHGKKLLWLVEQGKMVAPELRPKPLVRITDEKGYKHALHAMLQKLAEIRPLDPAAEMIASKRQLNQLFKWVIRGKPADKTPELLCGWRKVYGEQLLAVLA